ncbi:hypothetical protein BGZ65_002446 [Modicella reniformis]|uniref:Uncharacterized protein n=1 Tax=Modicella reniformis TaxID=1440133 RepID=A0A9P6M9N2_9FUNG|nr:hypothetical protein BGZ65_002446 [Modicella reniformis]
MNDVYNESTQKEKSVTGHSYPVSLQITDVFSLSPENRFVVEASRAETASLRENQRIVNDEIAKLWDLVEVLVRQMESMTSLPSEDSWEVRGANLSKEYLD